MEQIGPEETLSRFVFDNSKLSRDRVKYSAFLPRPGSDEVSVFRISSLAEEAIWSLAREYVEPGYGRKAVGRADFPVVAVFEAGLEITPTEPPPPRHANLIGWPSDREERRIRAMRLADTARPVLVAA